MKDWLKNRAKAVGKNLRKVGDAIGMPAQHLSLINTGARRIQSHEIIPMARELDWTPEELLAAAGQTSAAPDTIKAFSRDLAELDALALQNALEAIDELEKHMTIPAEKRARAILAVQNTVRKMLLEPHKKG